MTHSHKPEAPPLGATAGWLTEDGRKLGCCRAQLGACCCAIGLPDGIKVSLKPAA